MEIPNIEKYLLLCKKNRLIEDFKIYRAPNLLELKEIMGPCPSLASRSHKIGRPLCLGVDVTYYSNRYVGVDLEYSERNKTFESPEFFHRYLKIKKRVSQRNLLKSWTEHEASFKCLSLAGKNIRLMTEVERRAQGGYWHPTLKPHEFIRCESIWDASWLFTIASLSKLALHPRPARRATNQIR